MTHIRILRTYISQVYKSFSIFLGASIFEGELVKIHSQGYNFDLQILTSFLNDLFCHFSYLHLQYLPRYIHKLKQKKSCEVVNLSPYKRD